MAPAQILVGELVAGAKARLRSAPHAPPAREAHLLLAHVLGWTEGELLARDDAAVTEAQRSTFDELLKRRLQGEPVAYLTGRREFFGRSFLVDSRVLIPRPETEHLVEAALALRLPPDMALLDIGTGSGCIAVTLALELPARRVVATDRSLAALRVARRNALALGVGALGVGGLGVGTVGAGPRLRMLCTDWAAGLDLDAIGLVVANPPYIAPGDAVDLSPEISDFEPDEALFAGSRGLAAYTRIYESLRGLRPGTPVITEVGRGQAQSVASIASRHEFTVQRSIQDYAGIERVVVVNR